MIRPFPPLDPDAAFLPAPELEEWAHETFISEAGAIPNEDHKHLRGAEIRFLWAFVEASRGGRRIAGQAEAMPPMAMGKWARERAIDQMRGWFGIRLPDFLITIDARIALQADDASFCALVEHELYHCGQERDEFGGPKFGQNGQPKLAIRGHDIEEFAGVIRRYGAGVTDLAGIDTTARPEVAAAQVRTACGNCLKLAA